MAIFAGTAFGAMAYAFWVALACLPSLSPAGSVLCTQTCGWAAYSEYYWSSAQYCAQPVPTYTRSRTVQAESVIYLTLTFGVDKIVFSPLFAVLLLKLNTSILEGMLCICSMRGLFGRRGPEFSLACHASRDALACFPSHAPVSSGWRTPGRAL